MKILNLVELPENFSFNGLEIAPIKEYEENGQKFAEVCEPEEAEFWSVYVHLTEGGAMCIADVTSLEEAEKLAEFLKNLVHHVYFRELAENLESEKIKPLEIFYNYTENK